jgi:hypothetical protein
MGNWGNSLGGLCIEGTRGQGDTVTRGRKLPSLLKIVEVVLRLIAINI